MDAFAAYDIPKRGEKIVNYTEKHGRNVVDGHCLNREPSEIVVSVKMPIPRNGTKRPREPLLQLCIESG